MSTLFLEFFVFLEEEMIVYKVNVLSELKKAGYSSTRLRNEHILGERSIQNLRNGGLVSLDTINKFCAILRCRVEDLIEYVPDEDYQSSIDTR